MKKAVFVFLLALVGAWNCQAQSVTGMSNGWRFVQDNPIIYCGSSLVQTCTIGPAGNGGPISPTTPGSIWILSSGTQNNVTITSVTGGGGAWVHCPNCHAFNSSWSIDVWYNLSGTAGTFQGITFTLSGSPGNADSINFIEVLPPTGATASFDTSGNSANAACSSCSTVGLSLSATDVVIQIPEGANGNFGGGYMTDSNGTGFLLNAASGTAPSFVENGNARPVVFAAIAFKSSLGSFTPPAAQYALYQYVAYGNGNGSCSSCSIPLAKTTQAGDLVVVQAYAGGSVSSAPSGWVVPGAANGGCQVGSLSCAYTLSIAGGLTSVTVTMSSNASHNFAVWEFQALAGGTWSLDAQNNFTDSSGYNSGYDNNGPSLATTGSNDVAVQTLVCGGGSNGPSWYPYPQPFLKNTSIFTGPYNYFYLNEAASAAAIDTGPSVPTAVWNNCPDLINHAHPTYSSALAFTATGSGPTRPNPPTSLSAIVN